MKVCRLKIREFPEIAKISTNVSTTYYMNMWVWQRCKCNGCRVLTVHQKHTQMNNSQYCLDLLKRKYNWVYAKFHYYWWNVNYYINELNRKVPRTRWKSSEEGKSCFISKKRSWPLCFGMIMVCVPQTIWKKGKQSPDNITHYYWSNLSKLWKQKSTFGREENTFPQQHTSSLVFSFCY